MIPLYEDEVRKEIDRLAASVNTNWRIADRQRIIAIAQTLLVLVGERDKERERY